MQVIFGLVAIIFGLIGVLSPYTSWYMSTGWKLKDAEPSDAALFMNRVGGVFAIILGLIVMFFF